MMEEKIDEAEFWLPSEFLTDEDIVMDHTKERLGLFKSNPSALRFPAAFPYDYGSSALSSPVESLVGSTETESSDEEDFLLTGFTRQLTLHDVPKLIPTPLNQEKSKVLSGSPQSTLTKVGSWSGRSTMSSNGSPNGPSQVSSPPTTPLGVENDPWDLIYQAAGQIARLKMSGADGLTRNPGILGPPKRLPTPPPLKNPPPSCLYESHMMRQEACGLWNREVHNGWRFDSQDIMQSLGGRVGMAGGNGMGRSPNVWSSHQRNQQLGDFGVKGGAFVGGGYGYGLGYATGGGGGVCAGSGGVKRERAGTGVFLPRRYENNSNYGCKASEYRKKAGCSSGLLPNKTGQNLGHGLDNFSASVQAKARYINNGGTLMGDYETSVARRNALLGQQRRNIGPEGAMSHELCLPQEWTY